MEEREPQGAIESLSDDLALALGRAIWAFSVVESATFDYMQQLSREPLHELMNDQLFRARVKLVRRLIQRIDGFAKEKANATLLLERAEKLAETRNAIAHNPWRIWADFEVRELRANIQPPRANAKAHTLESIEGFTAEAQDVSVGLFSALASLPFVCNLP